MRLLAGIGMFVLFVFTANAGNSEFCAEAIKKQEKVKGDMSLCLYGETLSAELDDSPSEVVAERMVQKCNSQMDEMFELSYTMGICEQAKKHNATFENVNQWAKSKGFDMETFKKEQKADMKEKFRTDVDKLRSERKIKNQ